MKKFSFFWMIIFFFVLISCKDNEEEVLPPNDPPPSSDTKHIVQMSGNSFSPQNLSINVGDTVVWMNTGTMNHTSTSGSGCDPDGIWDSGTISPGAEYSFEFNQEGTLDYFCILHCGMGMVGTISVEE